MGWKVGKKPNKKQKEEPVQSKLWSWVAIILRWGIAGLFIYAGFSKILDPTSFVKAIDNYQILPYFWVTIAAIILPWIEVLCGVFLIFSKFRLGAAFILFGLSVIFFIAIASAVIRGLDISCGCFSSSGEATKLGLTRLFQEFLFLCATLFVYKSIEKTPVKQN
jgi:putative oxidoreductase